MGYRLLCVPSVCPHKEAPSLLLTGEHRRYRMPLAHPCPAHQTLVHHEPLTAGIDGHEPPREEEISHAGNGLHE